MNVSNSAIETYDDRDYLLGGEVVLDDPKHTYWDNKIEYHQPDTHKNSCTVHAAMGAYSDLTGHIFSLDERKDMWDMAIERGADPSIGWHLNMATKLVSDVVKDVDYWRVKVATEDFFKALDQGYTVICGYRGNAEYNKDRNDGTLDDLIFGTSTYGHAVRIVKAQDYYEIIVDNYSKGWFTNTYKIEREHLDDLVANGVFFQNGYVFELKVNEEKALKAKIKGLQVSKKIEINKATYKINKLEKDLAELEKREPVIYKVTT